MRVETVDEGIRLEGEPLGLGGANALLVRLVEAGADQLDDLVLLVQLGQGLLAGLLIDRSRLGSIGPEDVMKVFDGRNGRGRPALFDIINAGHHVLTPARTQQ